MKDSMDRPEAGPRRLEVGSVQAVRWWRCCALCSFFFFLEIFLFFFSWFYMWYFCLFEIPFPVCCGEMLLILQGPVPMVPGLWSSCSPFPVELTALSFCSPPSLLFFHSTDTVFPIRLSVFLPSLPNCNSWAESLYLTYFGSSSASTASSPSYSLKAEWLTSRSLFSLHLHFEKDLPVMSAQKSCRNHQSPGPSLCPLLLLLRKVGLWSLRLISRLSPQE